MLSYVVNARVHVAAGFVNNLRSVLWVPVSQDAYRRISLKVSCSAFPIIKYSYNVDLHSKDDGATANEVAGREPLGFPSPAYVFKKIVCHLWVVISPKDPCRKGTQT